MEAAAEAAAGVAAAAAAGVGVIAALPALSEVFAPSQTACMPPERWMRMAPATKATKAVSRQYSARSCPRSSECKAFRKRRTIAVTKPKTSLV